MTLGQEFEAYAVTLGEEIERLEQNAALFLEVNLGGTAIGTGINADPGYARARVAAPARDHAACRCACRRTSSRPPRTPAPSSCSRRRLKRAGGQALQDLQRPAAALSSGPRAGFGEINLPPMQPGSSIMPGKVNPVIPEVVNQVAFKVIGNDLTVTLAAEAGQLELNVMEPVIAQSLFESIEMLKNGHGHAAAPLHRRASRRTSSAAASMSSAPSASSRRSSPAIGYEPATELAREAEASGASVYELALEKKLLTRERLEELLRPEAMVRPRR